MPRKSKGLIVLDTLLETQRAKLRGLDSQIETLQAERKATAGIISGYMDARDALKAPTKDQASRAL
jgi:hypothetical protein